MNLQIFLKKFHKELADKCRGTAEFVEGRRAHFCVHSDVHDVLQRRSDSRISFDEGSSSFEHDLGPGAAARVFPVQYADHEVFLFKYHPRKPV